METTSFELTPAQRGLLASLALETGRPISVLLIEALEELQDHLHGRHIHVDPEAQGKPSALPPRKKRLGEMAEELFRDIPEEELARLPVDGAAQHDHYIYGLPKRSS